MAVYTTIDNSELYFQCKLYSGNGSTTNAITFDVTDTSMQPDMVWNKDRGAANWHNITDSGRGHSKEMYPNANNAEGTNAYVKSFDSNGFTIGSAGSDVNASGNNYASWCWKESTTAGFDIVTYTGNASTDRSISHGLSVAPKAMIIKNRSTAGSWMVYHDALGSNSGTTRRFLQLDNNNAQNNGSSGDFPAPPTSSVFKVGNFDTMNKSGDGIVSFLFHEVQGFLKIGSYFGNGNADGATVWCGLTPAFVLIKSTASGVWRMWDNKRDSLNPNTANFQSNAPDAEYDHSSVSIDFLSGGFKLKATDSSFNGSGVKYCFWAWAEAPFVNSSGVPCNAR